MSSCLTLRNELSEETCAGKARDFIGKECQVETEKAMAPHSSTFVWEIPWTEDTVHGVTKSRTRLSNFTFTFHFHALEKEIATHSSVLDWRLPGTGEPGGLSSMGSHRVGYDGSDLAAAAAASWAQFILN